MIEFLDELIEQFEEEGDLIVMRFFMSEQISVEMIMKHFIKFVYSHKEKIMNKDETFFIENDNIFGSSPKEKIVHFKNLYINMTEEDHETLWAWFRCFINICEKYIQLTSTS